MLKKVAARLSPLLLLLCCATVLRANGEGLRQRQALKDLTTAFSLMNVAAHPDDEDAGALTLARRNWGVRASIVVSNYGEGGQNAVGPELYEALGALRFHELRAAAAGYGVSRISSLGFVDFGFSKTAEETFRIWGGEEKVVDRLVSAIRKERPTVITTNHSPDEGHGNHRAVAIALLKAYRLAGDRQYKAELGEPWQAERLFQRVSKAERADVILRVDEKEPVTGRSYADLGREAYFKHASQGPWSPLQNAPRPRYYRLWGSVSALKLAPGAGSFFDGLPQPFPTEVGMNLRIIQKRYQNLLEAQILPEAGSALRQVQKDLNTLARMSRGLPGQFAGEKRRRVQASIDDLAQRLRNAKAELAGVQLEWASRSVSEEASKELNSPKTLDELLAAPSGEVIVGDPAIYRLEIRSIMPLRLKSLSANWPEGWKQIREVVPAGASPLVRYGVLRLSRDAHPNEPFSLHYMEENSPEITWRVVLTDGKIDVPYESSVRPRISPRLLISVSPDRWLAWRDDNVTAQVKLLNKSTGELRGELSASNGAALPALLPPGKTETISVPVRLRKQQKENELFRFAAVDGTNASEEMRVKPGEVRLPNLKKIGLIRHNDATTEEALRNLGVVYRVLGAADLESGDLAQFETILVDHRSYVLIPWLVENNDKLLSYARNGGHLVVFYQRAGEFNIESGYPMLAPYPIHLSSERVSVEEAPVKILIPGHALLHKPNEIGPDDFEGWVQERGLYYPDKWDSHYEALLSTNDPGEKSLNGGLLVASVGKGTYIYTSYVWYRQWKELHNGAFQMLANLLGYR